jgi:hypothetical protein
VPSFTYNPTDNRSPLLFELTCPLDDLENVLLQDFRGRRLSLKELYKEHSVGRPYLLKNYREVLRKLENRGKIRADPPADRRRVVKGEVSFNEKVMITFPR